MDGERCGAIVLKPCCMHRSEEAQTESGDPIGERRLFEITDAVHMESNPIAGAEHGLRGLGVRGIRVVEQWRIAKRGRENDEPQT